MGQGRVTQTELEALAGNFTTNGRVTETEMEVLATETNVPKGRATFIEMEVLFGATPDPISQLTRPRNRVQRFGKSSPRQRFGFPFG